MMFGWFLLQLASLFVFIQGDVENNAVDWSGNILWMATAAREEWFN